MGHDADTPEGVFTILRRSRRNKRLCQPPTKAEVCCEGCRRLCAALLLGARRLFGADHVASFQLTSNARQGALAPTKEDFRRVCQDIARDATADDVLVIYLAGHGVARAGVRDMYYYLTRDARNTDLPVLLDKVSVSSEKLKSWCLTIKALKHVTILDTCAAGAANAELVQMALARDLSPDQARAMELLKDSTGSHVFMGSAADAVSYEAGRYGQGLVTYALLQGMKGAALDDGNKVDVRRLFDYAQREVEELAEGIGGIQRPTVSSPKGSSFPIGILDAADKQAIHLASAKPQLLRVICLDENDDDSTWKVCEPLRELREQLREASHPLALAETLAEPLLVYLDDVVDDVAGALVPRVRYVVSNGGVRAKLTLRRDGRLVAERQVDQPNQNVHALAGALGKAILEKVAKLR